MKLLKFNGIALGTYKLSEREVPMTGYLVFSISTMQEVQGQKRGLRFSEV